MRLLNPSPGEILDRVSILELKIKYGEKKGIDTARFLAEKSLLEEQMQNWNTWLREDKPPQSAWDTIAQKKNGLAAINALLWETEDMVRATDKTDVQTLAMCCVRVYTLNDGRADLVHELSKLYGADEVHEKIYSEKDKKAQPFLVKSRAGL